MPNPLTSADIEDVLGSIRRLVSEEAAARARKSGETERLVLTQAYRVNHDAAPKSGPLRFGGETPAREPRSSLAAELDDLEASVSRKAAQWRDEEPAAGGLDAARLDAATALAAATEAAELAALDPVVGDPEEAVAAEPDAAEIDADGGEEAGESLFDAGAADVVAGPDDEAFDGEAASADVFEFHHVGVDVGAESDVIDAPAADAQAETAQEETAPIVAGETVEPGPAWNETAEGDEAFGSPDVEPTSEAEAEAEAEAEEEIDAAHAVDAEIQSDIAAGASEGFDAAEAAAFMAASSVAAAKVAAEPETYDEWEPAGESGQPGFRSLGAERTETAYAEPPTIEADLVRLDTGAMGVPPATAPETNMTTADAETFLDEAELRALVAEVLREELKGPLGERITRNVRKLVRREIAQALNSMEID